jgi:hypothetical protein
MEIKYWPEIADPREMSEGIFSVYESLRDSSAARLMKMQRMTQLYKDRDIAGFDLKTWAMMPQDFLAKRLSYNVVRSCTDTVVAKLSLHEPAVSVSTFGGDYEQQRRAKFGEYLCHGAMQHQNAYLDAVVPALRDACIYPMGIVKTMESKGVLQIRRVHPSRLFWDDAATPDDPPVGFYEPSLMDRREALARYPKSKTQILAAPNEWRGIPTGRVHRDVIEVVEAFSLGESGEHALACRGGVLFLEGWGWPEPYTFFRWGIGKELLGFEGISLADELEGIQGEINFILDVIRGNAEVMAAPFWQVPAGSEITVEDLLTNKPYRMVRYTGKQPEVITPPIVHPQIFQYLESLLQKAYELPGISQLSASGKKPADLESGAALREYNDFETIRFSPPAKGLEAGICSIGRNTLRAACRLSKTNKKWSVPYLGRSGPAQKVSWSDFALDEDSYITRIYPMSAFPQQPAARVQAVADLAEKGLLDRSQFLHAANISDIDEQVQLMDAPMEDLKRIFEKMLSGGKYIRPVEFQNLELGISLAIGYWSRGHCDGIEQERLDLLEQWMADAARLRGVGPTPSAGAPVADVTSAPLQAPPPGMGGIV